MTPEQRHQLAIVKDQQEPAIKPRYIYSDTLFQPWAAITTDTSAFTSYSNVDRRSADSLTLEEFITQYEQPGIPVIITDLVTKWPAFGQWSLPWLVSHHGDTARFRAEALSMTLREYASYHDRVFADEAPLYLFDKHFGETCPGLSDDFTVPSYFGCEDLFGVLKDSEHGRPDYRWVIVGPDRSASTWHKDPNATSAWNAIVSQTGAKKWMFWPPDMVPPGVYTDKDESEVTSPISVPSWFNSFYKEAHKLIRPMEAVCNPGEVIFVPSGWWHCVLNLGANIAITQNYVSRRNLTSVAAFLYKKRDQVSGCREGTGESLYERFKEAMQKQHPDYWDAHCSEIEKHEADAAENQPTLWERLQSGTDCGDSGETNTSGNGSSSSSGGFTFGFAF
ncbi:Clavaminate synthase-like protein [Ramicandelaber brevisporus]|nr:Clavaminate synthase-like protein [Ramicandelaber brevisporus]